MKFYNSNLIKKNRANMKTFINNFLNVNNEILINIKK